MTYIEHLDKVTLADLKQAVDKALKNAKNPNENVGKIIYRDEPRDALYLAHTVEFLALLGKIKNIEDIENLEVKKQLAQQLPEELEELTKLQEKITYIIILTEKSSDGSQILTLQFNNSARIDLINKGIGNLHHLTDIIAEKQQNAPVPVTLGERFSYFRRKASKLVDEATQTVKVAIAKKNEEDAASNMSNPAITSAVVTLETSTDDKAITSDQNKEGGESPKSAKATLSQFFGAVSETFSTTVADVSQAFNEALKNKDHTTSSDLEAENQANIKYLIEKGIIPADNNGAVSGYIDVPEEQPEEIKVEHRTGKSKIKSGLLKTTGTNILNQSSSGTEIATEGSPVSSGERVRSASTTSAGSADNSGDSSIGVTETTTTTGQSSQPKKKIKSNQPKMSNTVSQSSSGDSITSSVTVQKDSDNLAALIQELTEGVGYSEKNKFDEEQARLEREKIEREVQERIFQQAAENQRLLQEKQAALAAETKRKEDAEKEKAAELQRIEEQQRQQIEQAKREAAAALAEQQKLDNEAKTQAKLDQDKLNNPEQVKVIEQVKNILESFQYYLLNHEMLPLVKSFNKNFAEDLTISIQVANNQYQIGRLLMSERDEKRFFNTIEAYKIISEVSDLFKTNERLIIAEQSSQLATNYIQKRDDFLNYLKAGKIDSALVKAGDKALTFLFNATENAKEIDSRLAALQELTTIHLHDRKADVISIVDSIYTTKEQDNILVQYFSFKQDVQTELHPNCNSEALFAAANAFQKADISDDLVVATKKLAATYELNEILERKVTEVSDTIISGSVQADYAKSNLAKAKKYADFYQATEKHKPLYEAHRDNLSQKFLRALAYIFTLGGAYVYSKINHTTLFFGKTAGQAFIEKAQSDKNDIKRGPGLNI